MSDDKLWRLVDEARADDAAGARSRQRWLRQQADEEATMAGVLQDLAERAAPVSVATTSGRAHQGRILGLGADFCLLRPATGRLVYLTLWGLAFARPAPDLRLGHAAGDRAPPHDLRIAELLAIAAAERPRVSLYAHGHPAGLSGELRMVGVDVVTVRLDGEGRAACYVALATLTECGIDAW